MKSRLPLLFFILVGWVFCLGWGQPLWGQSSSAQSSSAQASSAQASSAQSNIKSHTKVSKLDYGLAKAEAQIYSTFVKNSLSNAVARVLAKHPGATVQRIKNLVAEGKTVSTEYIKKSIEHGNALVLEALLVPGQALPFVVFDKPPELQESSNQEPSNQESSSQESSSQGHDIKAKSGVARKVIHSQGEGDLDENAPKLEPKVKRTLLQLAAFWGVSHPDKGVGVMRVLLLHLYYYDAKKNKGQFSEVNLDWVRPTPRVSEYVNRRVSGTGHTAGEIAVATDNWPLFKLLQAHGASEYPSDLCLEILSQKKST